MKPSCPDSFCLSLACSLLVLFGFASKSRAALPLLELGPILAQTVIGQSASSEVLLYIHTDHLGTPVMMTDEQGKTVWETDAEPFGETTITAQPGVTLNLRFPGQYFDSETGLHYNYFRNYNPTTGRYLVPDPLLSLLGPMGLGLARDLNPYPYVGNNPVGWIDPWGLWTAEGHEVLTTTVMKRAGFSDTDIRGILVGNLRVDLPWNQSNNPEHYMPGTGLVAEKIIEQRLNEAIQREIQGDRRGAMEALGGGLHTLQDKWAHQMQNAGWKQHNWLDKRNYADPDEPSKHPKEYASALRESQDYVRRFLAQSGSRAMCPR